MIGGPFGNRLLAHPQCSGKFIIFNLVEGQLGLDAVVNSLAHVSEMPAKVAKDRVGQQPRGIDPVFDGTGGSLRTMNRLAAGAR